MNSPVDILKSTLGLSQEHSERLMAIVRDVAAQSAASAVTVGDMLEKTDDDPPLMKNVLMVLLLGGVLRGRFAPYHLKCGKKIGPDEESENAILQKFDDGEYSDLCPNCHDYVEGYDDLKIRILFSLPRDRA